MTLLDTTKTAPQADELCVFINEIVADKRLATHEVEVQKAWLNGLVKTGLFNATERDLVSATLDEAARQVETGQFPWDVRDEDIHMHLERFVTNHHGELGKRMHIGRSRNDLVATTLRLYIRDACNEQSTKLSQLVKALTDKAESTLDIIVPGTTHLQHGQPVHFSHILLSHAEAFLRDKKHLKEVADLAMDVMPLGAAALVGTPLEIDLDAISKQLGFSQPCRNSYDAVGDRDFMLGALDAFARIGLHLSRMSEDVVYWASTPVGLVKLPHAWSTGSSIMPNKRNPELAELTRGRSAHIIAAQTNGYMLMRTAPTSYAGELQELKGVVMRAHDNLTACFTVWPPFIEKLHISKQRAAELLDMGHILATEIADNLTMQGVPFREAYARVKDLVDRAEVESCQIHKLPAEVLGVHFLSAEQATTKRAQAGGTAPVRIREAITRIRRDLVVSVL